MPVFRQLNLNDIPNLDKHLSSSSGCKKPSMSWKDYLGDLQSENCMVQVVDVNDEIVGIGVVKLTSEFQLFHQNNIPQFDCVFIAEPFRNRGLGRGLVALIESLLVKKGYKQAGVGLGLTREYGVAQKLFVGMGYVPIIEGITFKNQPVTAGQYYTVDDDLVLWLVKSL